jgi:hypothetical protein
MTKRALWLCVAVAVIIGVGIVVYLHYAFMTAGGAGWHANRSSERAVRAYSVDRRLRRGMQKTDVLKIFKMDVVKNPDDRVYEADVTFNRWTRPCPAGTCTTDSGAGQFELVLTDLPHGIERFGTAWSVRARFDGRGLLVEHGVHEEDCCGP